ncbi:MAG TPA: toxin-antitoxin system HicB family antitoxin [Thermoguttaceae bacterium]|nr:toxin-antitoxin system HicB family antitoxin [Thermoguttaceae bacterium]
MTAIEKEVQQLAQSLYTQSPDWMTFYREVFGLQGAIRQRFPTRSQLDEFEQTEAYREIQEMLAKLREHKPPVTNPEEPTQAITVRLPKSVHEALRVEAHEHRTSMNKLCISKLLQFIDDELIPSDV